MKNEQTLSELDKLNASRKFIDDKNYTKKQKDAFVEFIRDCQKREDIKIIDKTLDKIWVKDKKQCPEDWENGHRAGWNDCIEYLDEKLKTLLGGDANK